MNIRKSIDYSTLYAELDKVLSENRPQMEEIHAIGRAICKRQEKGAAVAASEFLQSNYPDRSGFSPRNVRRMRDFYRTYENDEALLRLALNIGWTLNVVIMEAELIRAERKWYLEQAQEQQWSKRALQDAICGNDFAKNTELSDDKAVTGISQITGFTCRSRWYNCTQLIQRFCNTHFEGIYIIQSRMRRRCAKNDFYGVLYVPIGFLERVW